MKRFCREKDLYVGACIDFGRLDQLDLFLAEDLGNYALFGANYEMARRCANNGIYFRLREVRDRKTLSLNTEARENCCPIASPEILRRIAEDCFPYFLGRAVRGEAASVCYLPESYLGFDEKSIFHPLPVCSDLIAAREMYIQYVKKGIRLEREFFDCDLNVTDPSLFHCYNLAGGADLAILETMVMQPEIAFAAVRGASKAIDKKIWGSHIAMSWYGGNKVDCLWLHRWRLSLYLSYLAGASYIYSENGHFTNHAFGKELASDSVACSAMRSQLKEFWRFAANFDRPGKLPVCKIGFLHGNLDGYSGMWRKEVWGQAGSVWSWGDAEKGWQIINDTVGVTTSWANPYNTGDSDVSGQVPYGQYDIVPADAAAKVLQNYDLLVFTGWNTMTDKIYNSLMEFVRNGGRLLIGGCHLRTNTRRDDQINLFRDGNLKELLGLRIIVDRPNRKAQGFKFTETSQNTDYNFPNWSDICDPKWINHGIPFYEVETYNARPLARFAERFSEEHESGLPGVMFEHRLGNGFCYFINSPSWFGNNELYPFVRDIVACMLAGEVRRCPLKVAGGALIRHAVFKQDDFHTVILCNTDPHCCIEFQVLIQGISRPIALKPGALQVFYFDNEKAIFPAEPVSLWKRSSKNNYEPVDESATAEIISLL